MIQWFSLFVQILMFCADLFCAPLVCFAIRIVMLYTILSSPGLFCESRLQCVVLYYFMFCLMLSLTGVLSLSYLNG